jgi:hypothetical protein
MMVGMVLQEPAGTLRFTQWNVKSENGSDLQMRFGMNVNLVKGQVWNYYPLQREKLYNLKPWELLIYTEDKECRDDPRQKDVTCQWYCLVSSILGFLISAVPKNSSVGLFLFKIHSPLFIVTSCKSQWGFFPMKH